MYKYILEVNKIISQYEQTLSPKYREKNCYRIKKFFTEFMSKPEHQDRKLMEITEKEIDDFLNNLPYKQNEKVNYYRFLKAFFDYCFIMNYTRVSFLNIKKIEKIEVPFEYISNKHFKDIVAYINNDKRDRINNRLLLSLFLYTGLSRKYIHNMNFSQFNDNLTEYYVVVNSEDITIPLKSELTATLREFKEKSKITRQTAFFPVNDDTISSTVKRLSQKACGHGYTPTAFSSTFIKLTLGDEKDKNIYAVSKLILESLGTIEKHIDAAPNWLIDRQNEILKKW